MRTCFQPVFLGALQRACGTCTGLAELGGLLRIAREQVRQRERGVDLGDDAVDARDRSPPERDNRSDKPERAKGEKRTPLTRRIAEAEAEIARINGIIAKIDAALALPDLFTRDPKQAAQLSKARAGAATALQRAEEDWLEASSQYDEAAG